MCVTRCQISNDESWVSSDVPRFTLKSRAEWVRVEREKVSQTGRKKGKRGGQRLEKYAKSQPSLPNLSTIPPLVEWSSTARWSAGMLHTISVGVRAEGQGCSRCSGCQSKVKRSEYWFRHADLYAYNMCRICCYRLIYDGDEGLRVHECVKYTASVFVGGVMMDSM